MLKKLLSAFMAAMLLGSVPAMATAREIKNSVAADEQMRIAFWDFETDPAKEGWRFIDSDGDDYNWEWVADTAAGQPITASGTHALKSRSFISGPGELTPDNWAYTPAVELPANASATFNYQVASYSSNYRENYRLYVFVDGAEDYSYESEELISPDSMRIFEARSLDLSEYAGHSVVVAFRHTNISGNFSFYIDDVEFTAQENETEEVPAELVFGSYFEENSSPIDEGWSFVDNDGDGNNWRWYAKAAAHATEGTGIIGSQSYNYSLGGNLNPDNWAISPAIELPHAQLSLTFYAKGCTLDYYSEHFAVYAGTSPDTAEMVQIMEETVTGNPAVLYSVDLSQFANERVYIAIRHFNTDPGMDCLVVDKFEVWATPLPQKPLGDVNFNGNVDTADALMVLRHAMRLSELSEEQLDRAEVNGDGEVNIADALLVLRKAMELITF